MSTSTRTSIALGILTLFLVLGLSFLALQSHPASRFLYVRETDKLIREPFLSSYREMGGKAFLGNPLTNVYLLADGTYAQTFEQGQLVLTVQGVKLASIAGLFRLEEGEGPYQTDMRLVHFYEENGGRETFGDPVSDLRVEGNRLVQDFENARLLLDPGGEVRLAEIGPMLLSLDPPPFEGPAAIGWRSALTAPSELSASVSVEAPVVRIGERQTLYLLVLDQADRPVAGVKALAVLRYNDGLAEVTLPETDTSGIAQTSFMTPPAAPGSQVLVTVHVLYGEFFFTVDTTFVQWW